MSTPQQRHSSSRRAIPLPSETLLSIIRLALPVVESTSFAERYLTLRCCSVVCKAWRPLAQQELFLHLKLARPSLAYNFLVVTESKKASRLKSLGRIARTLRLGGPEGDGVDTDRFENCDLMVLSILIACPGLEELWLNEVMSVDPAVLSWAVGLRSLHLSDVHLRSFKASSDGPFLWHFPHLTTLFLTSITVGNSASAVFSSTDFLLNALSLPVLATLCYTWDSKYSSPPTLTHLGPQLSSLYLSRTIPTNATTCLWPSLPDLSPCINLSHLSLDIRVPLDFDVLALVPHPLKTLRIDATRNAIETIEAALFESGAECLEEVERLELPRSNERRSETALKRREETREWCFQRRVELVERNGGEDVEDQVAMRWVEMVERRNDIVDDS